MKIGELTLAVAAVEGMLGKNFGVNRQGEMGCS